MAITEEQFRQAQAANPGIELEVLQHDKLPDEVIARVPTATAWVDFLTKLKKSKREANRALVDACVVFPPEEVARKLIAARPAIVGVWATKIREMAGESDGGRHRTKSDNSAIQAKYNDLMVGSDVELEILQHDRLPDEVIARVPNEDQYEIFEKQRDDGRGHDGCVALIDFCVVYPPKAELQKSLDAHPALVEVWAGELVEMAGGAAVARRKKF